MKTRKKTISTVGNGGLIALLAISTAFGQSGYWLNNYFNQGVNAPVFDAQGIPLAGTNYLAELWGGAMPDSLTPAVAFYSRQRVIVPFLIGLDAGYFVDSYANRSSADHPTVLSVPPYVAMAWLEVRAWDARLGSTYEQVVSLGLGGYGESPLFSATGTSPADLLILPAPLTGLQSFNLRPVVPEPGAVGLLFLGGLLLLWRKRFGR